MSSNAAPINTVSTNKPSSASNSLKISSLSVGGFCGCCGGASKVEDPTLPAPKSNPKPVAEVKSDDHKWNIYKDYPKFHHQNRSLLATHLTPAIFDQLKSVKTEKGYEFSYVIQTGVEIPNTVVGTTAGDEESYEKFSSLFDPIIKDWHGYDVERSPIHFFNFNFSDINISEEQRELFASFVISSKVEGSRNVTGHSFPGAADEKEKEIVEAKIKDVFKSIKGNSAGEYFELEKIDKKKAADLKAKGLFFEKPSKSSVLDVSGAGRLWAKARGIFVAQSEKGRVKSRRKAVCDSFKF
jgi:hypothetical protein